MPTARSTGKMQGCRTGISGLRAIAHHWPDLHFQCRSFACSAPLTRSVQRSNCTTAGNAPHSYAEARYYGPPATDDENIDIPPPQIPLVIGVAGGTASGKTSVCQQIISKLQQDSDACSHRVLSVSQDCFYRDLTPPERASIASYNFDHPDAFDFGEIRATLRALRAGAAVDIPTYDFVASARTPVATRVPTTDVILFDGILAFYDPEVRGLFDLRVFVDADADTRLVRRLRRDISERGRTVDAVLNQYERTVKPSFESYIAPTKKHADVIVPRGAENAVAIDLLWQTIRYRLQPRLEDSPAAAAANAPAHA